MEGTLYGRRVKPVEPCATLCKTAWQACEIGKAGTIYERKNKASLFFNKSTGFGGFTRLPCGFTKGFTRFYRFWTPAIQNSPNSVCLRGSNDVSVPGSKRVPFFLTCPGFRFYGPRNTFHAHAWYLVMVSCRFDGKKHCFNAGSSEAITKSILIIDVFETS